MTNKIIILIVILLVIAIYYLLKKRKKKQCKYGEENCPQADSDYNRVKTISPISCIECGNCAIENKGCCANCNSPTNLAVERHSFLGERTHCSEHNHSHHHHHKIDYSHHGNSKELFS